MRNSILTALAILCSEIQGDIESKMKSKDKILGFAFECSRSSKDKPWTIWSDGNNMTTRKKNCQDRKTTGLMVRASERIYHAKQ